MSAQDAATEIKTFTENYRRIRNYLFPRAKPIATAIRRLTRIGPQYFSGAESLGPFEIDGHFNFEECLPRPTPTQKIIYERLGQHGVTQDELLSRSKVRNIVRCRQDVMYHLYMRTKLSASQIALRVGCLDHSSVLHGVQAFAKLHGLERPRRK